MAINKNHEFEELEGVKCGIVERMVTPERLQFIKSVLECNGYQVIAIPSPPPKSAVPAPTVEENPGPEPPAAPQTFTVGVTDYTFNTINAIFGRALKTRDGKIVTLAYWRQEDKVADNEKPYFQKS